MLVALVVVVTFGCTWWSWHYQKVMSELLPAHPSPLPPTSNQSEHKRELGQTTAIVRLHQIECLHTQPTTSVLGWEAFSIASALLLDGTVLVSCTRRLEKPPWRGRFGDDGSLVLLIGDDEQATRAFHLIEDWRAAGTTLQLRPTTSARTIELYDRRDNALRAQLLAT